MIAHYLKIGLRNICRYKQQSVVSIVGLAIGFVCFALSLLWIRYEMTYNRITDSDRIFLLSDKKGNMGEYFNRYQSFFKERYPEIESMVSLLKVELVDTLGRKKELLQVTPGFFELFDIQFLAGDKEQFFTDSLNLLITDKEIQKNFGGKYEFGKQIDGFTNTVVTFTYPYSEDNIGDIVPGYTDFDNPVDWHGKPAFRHSIYNLNICGMVRDLPIHSDFSFDYIMPYRENDRYGPKKVHTFVKLHKGADYKKLSRKLDADLPIIREAINNPYYMPQELYPLQDFHLSEYFTQYPHNMSFDDIVIFAIAGFITVICLLFNYLSLFMSRLQQERRNMALRLAVGASFGQLYAMLCTEFLFILFGAFLIGCLTIELIMPVYLEFTGMEEFSFAIWGELTLYFLSIVAFSFVLLIWPLYYIRNKSFVSLFHTVETARENRLFSQNVLIGIQLLAGIVFIFCSAVFIKQIHHMKNIDPGFDPTRLCFVENRSVNKFSSLYRYCIDKIVALPELESVCYCEYGIIEYHRGHRQIILDDIQSEGQEKVGYCFGYAVTPEYFDVCKIKCLQGRLFDAEDLDWNKDKVIISQSVARQFGEGNPIGLSLTYNKRIFQVIGITPDIFASGKQEPIPAIYLYSKGDSYLAFRYKPGMRKEAEQKIKEMISNQRLVFRYMEERFETESSKDLNFMRLLYILTSVCIVGALFGIYSMVSLACERRRKEIAIRKINGAGYGTLIKLFLKKYILLLVVACAMAFPTGYLLMKPWLEKFVLRTSIDGWVYGSILAAVAVMISGIVIARIWRTLHANPANEIRKE